MRRLLPHVWRSLSLGALALTAAAQGPQAIRTSRAVSRAIDDSTVSTVFLSEPGTLVEAAGLKRWTIPMIQDSLAVYSPGMTLYRQSCRDAFQRDFTIFPQSVVVQTDVDSQVTVFLAVIEPQDAGLITVRKFMGDPEQSRAPWPQLVELTRTRFGQVRQGMLESITARAGGLAPALTKGTRADSVEFTQVWATLAAHQTAEDLTTARQLLLSSPNVHDRLAALVILSNFDQNDAAWHALAGALLDPHGMVREYARAVLRAFTADFPRRVDWRPAAAELHALLQGSDLWSLNETLDMLVATGVGPELAAPSLKDGGYGLMLFAGARNPWARFPAYRFLHAISGQDLGGNPETWRRWIASL